MPQTRLLVVDDDADIARLLKYYFTGLGYHVDVAGRGREALDLTRQVMPHIIILDIILPDIDGYEICQNLRQHTRTSQIPILFLTQKDERSSRLQGLELGADDYITKPFDIEELRLRLQNALSRSERERLTDPVTCLPAGQLIENELRRLLPMQDWALLDIRLNNYEFYRVRRGQQTAQDTLQNLAVMLGSVLDEHDGSSDFLGHAGGANFILTTNLDHAEPLRQAIKERFGASPEKLIAASEPPEAGEPLLSLSVGLVKSTAQKFTDIREITEMAAESRRREPAIPLPFQRP
jgi:DNA-binding response OmpR family regulator